VAADGGLHLRSIHRRATSERCETGLEIEAHFGFYQSSNVPRELGREQIPILTYRGTDFLPEDFRYTPLVLAILKGPRVRIAPSPSLFQRLNAAAGGERKYPVRDFGRGRARRPWYKPRSRYRRRNGRRLPEPLPVQPPEPPLAALKGPINACPSTTPPCVGLTEAGNPMPITPPISARSAEPGATVTVVVPPPEFIFT
jgi:hypothetical protein